MNKIQLCDIYSCTQCRACEQVCPKHCISFVEGKDGFEFPHIDTDLCIECGACVKSCHQLSLTKEKNQPLYAYAAWSNDEQVRTTSSSGGVFSEIARYVFEKNGVVAGAVMDEDLKVRHTFATDMESLFPMRGSKYVQSKIGDTYKLAKDFLDSGRKVLFTGTPCQIGGLYSYLRKPYDSLFTQDIICHGVPSPMVWEKYVEEREKKAVSTTQRMFFRHKKYGWKTYSVLFEFSNNTEYVKKYHEDLFMKAFLNDLCLRPSCYYCSFKSLNSDF